MVILEVNVYFTATHHAFIKLLAECTGHYNTQDLEHGSKYIYINYMMTHVHVCSMCIYFLNVCLKQDKV